jgi:hypothetical protein
MLVKLARLFEAKYAVILLALVTVLAYANSLRNDFVWDDYSVIVDNDFVKSLSNLPGLFSRAYLSDPAELGSGAATGSGETTYRPVVTLSYFADYRLWGLNPFGYHLFNVFLHLVNVILFYLFLRMFPAVRTAAVLSALFFAVHPVNSEAVNVISFREDLLVFLFSISSFIFFIKRDSVRSGGSGALCMLFSSGLYLLALFSKESALVLPILLALYDYFFVFKQNARELFLKAWKRYFWYVPPILIYAAAWIALKGPGGIICGQYPYPGGSFYTNILTMAGVFSTYVSWLLIPVNIHAFLPENDPAYTLHSFYDPRAFFSVALVILLFAAALAARRKYKLVSFSIFWFFITLAPVSNVIPISCLIASRYLYLSSCGFCIGLAVVLTEAYRFRKGLASGRLFREMSVLAAAVILACYFMFTAIRSLAWKNNIVVWQELTEASPDNPQAHINLANQFRGLGLFDAAFDEYRIAVSLDPAIP